MEYLTAKKFSFVSDAISPDTFGVVRFRGSEALSKCYEFEILLVSSDLKIELDAVLRNPARLVIHREKGDDVRYQGILLSFEQLHSFGGVAFYRAHLVPRLHWLSLTHHNQVILRKSLPDFLADVLRDGGLNSGEFEFRLMESFPPKDFVCQYCESHLNFVSRWLEREGIYYFFEQTRSGEKVIFTDSRIAHVAMPQGKTVRYSPPSGLEALHLQEIVGRFTCRYSLTPASVIVRDYNDMRPSLDVGSMAEVNANGRGQFYSYGDYVLTPEEGKRVAKMYADSLSCRREVYHGEGSVPYVCPGFTFNLEGHFRRAFNRGYITIEVEHEGNQTGYLLAGLTMEGEQREVYYRNRFVAIPDTVQFRPERKTPRPRIRGTLPAKVDAAGSGRYAQLDEQGRYKVVLPFDLSGRKDGKASAWVRMAQPYAGSGHGMHFPLHRGTEVLLTFIDGDPDRPIIAGAVPNPETPSPVTAENQTMAAITTSGGNKIHIEDQEGSERILMHSPKQGSFVRIGAPNDPDSPGWDFETGKKTDDSFGIHLLTNGLLDITVQTANKIVLGEETEAFFIGYALNSLGLRWDTTIGLEGELNMSVHKAFDSLCHTFHPETITVGGQAIEIKGSKIRFIGNASEIVGNHTKVTGTATKVSGEHTIVEGNADNVTGKGARVEGIATNVTGNDTVISGNATTVTGNGTRVNGSATTITGDNTSVSGNGSKVTSGTVTLTRDNTEVSATLQEITTQDTEITGYIVLA